MICGIVISRLKSKSKFIIFSVLKCHTEVFPKFDQVEIQLHGPFDSSTNGLNYIVTLRDPFSNWLEAKVLESDEEDRLASNVADIVFSTLCRFGFTNCDVVAKSRQFFSNFLTHVSVLWSSLDVIGLMPDHIFNFVDERRRNLRNGSITEKILEFVQVEQWNLKLDAWLFQYRTSIQVQKSHRIWGLDF